MQASATTISSVVSSNIQSESLTLSKLVTGLPLSEVNQLGGREAQTKTADRKATDITLVRSRIFYSRAALNARGLVRPGFKHIRKLHATPPIFGC